MKGQKETSAPTTNIAGSCLSVVSIGNAPMPKIQRHLHLINSFHEGMLKFDGAMRQCFSRADFRPFHREVGEGEGERGRKVQERQKE